MAPSATQKSAAKNNADTPSSTASDIEGQENEWKFRAPYKIHSNKKDAKNGNGNGDKDGGEGRNGEGEDGGEEEFNAIYEGACHCGKVRYQLGRERPLASKFCHCGTCQMIHGAPFQHAAIFHKEDINFLKGHHDLQWYDSTEKTTRHKLPCKVSCVYCGSWIMDEGRNMILLFPSLINFKDGEERKKFLPECHMFYENRVVDINDGLPKWSGMQGKSELIGDSPVEAVKKRKREVEEEEREERAKRRGGEDEGGDKDEDMDGGEK
ncbi:Mss4-like protein [Cadophora sp. MPI-SDFR-AT-0126]|nr:Mss4-like protein [Leotiomycetes sp. MPI-SDFR-AT-0126]